jgi:hypothetical protein
LGFRSIAATRDGAAIIAGVHVGGLPYSLDKGNTWKPIIPIMFDVHDVRAHPALPNIVAAATARRVVRESRWRTYLGGSLRKAEQKYSLAVAVSHDEVLPSVSSKRS